MHYAGKYLPAGTASAFWRVAKPVRKPRMAQGSSGTRPSQNSGFTPRVASAAPAASSWSAIRKLPQHLKTFFSTLAADRKLLTIPADATVSAKLAKHYANASLGEIAVSTSGASTIFDFGEWKSEVSQPQEPRWHDFFYYHCARLDRFRVRSRIRAQANIDHSRRATRIHIRGALRN